MSAGTRSGVNKVLSPDFNGKHRQELRLNVYREKRKSSRKKIKLILFPSLNLVNSPGVTHTNSRAFL